MTKSRQQRQRNWRLLHAFYFSPLRTLRPSVQNRPLVAFLVCAVMFHFANAATLPLLGLAAVASAAFGILYLFLPQTRDKRFLNQSL